MSTYPTLRELMKLHPEADKFRWTGWRFDDPELYIQTPVHWISDNEFQAIVYYRKDTYLPDRQMWRDGPCDGYHWEVYTEISDTTTATKYDNDKPPLSLLSRSALEGCAKVLGFGAEKYAAHNWRQGMEWSRVISSLLRHTMAFNEGEDIDPESGLPHVYHMMCNAMFLADYYTNNIGKDDRYEGIQST